MEWPLIRRLLTPYPDVTSLALIALRTQRNHPVVQESLEWLRRPGEGGPFDVQPFLDFAGTASSSATR